MPRGLSLLRDGFPAGCTLAQPRFSTRFNLHSEGATGSPDTYDTAAVDGSGNVKVWATINSSTVIRVMVMEKDVDSGSKTINLNRGSSYSSTATQLTMSSSTGAGGNESHISISGAVFNVTTINGLPNGTPGTTT